jgi:cytochrome c-type biogenesis protein CcmH/NrfF
VKLRWLVWVLALGLAGGALVWAAVREPDDPKARVDRLTAEIRCPDCEGLSAADSFTSSARAIRRDVAARVVRGQSDDQIRKVYVDRYGESILLDPESSGIGVLVWGLPVLVLVLGAGGLALAVRRWRAQPLQQASAADQARVAAALAPARDTPGEPRDE